jgi:universal stress protein E
MNTLKTILVAVDFSTGSRAALEQAARIAGFNNAKLHILHVVDSAAVATLAGSREESYESHARTASQGAASALERWMAQSALPAGCEVTIALGVPLHEILDHVRTLKADLLVAGIAGAGESAAGAGSVSSKLARKAQVPVLLVRSNHPHAFRKMVACIDFSDTAREVVRQACHVAAQDGARVDFLHVWREPWVVQPYGGMSEESTYPAVVFTHEERQAYIQNLHQELHEFVHDAAQGIKAAEVLHEAMNYGAGIADHAQEREADLVVIGSKGRTNLRYVLMGSTAERLLTRLPCSLLVVKLPPAE